MGALLIFSFFAAVGFSESCAARTCPAPEQLFVEHNGVYDVSLPAGWVLVDDTRQSKSEGNIVFRVAAWGDHKHPVDPVRCYYYPESINMHNGQVEIETADMMDESHVSEWGTIGVLYHICSQTTDVRNCQFV
jgi:hypothetical protein